MRAWKQCSLDEARKPAGHGGWRPGAGRPKGRTTASHAKRASFSTTTPQHVTLKIASGAPSLRRGRLARVVRGAIGASHKDDFRVVEFNVLSNHVHLIVEAGSQRALTRGMMGLEVRIAKHLNTAMGRKGRIFAERYHAHALRTPREVKNAIRYVLLNARHHAAQHGEQIARGWIDPFSSALWFDGWRRAIRTTAPWLHALRAEPPPTRAARSWLLTTGWRLHGLIDPDDVPGRRAQAYRR